MAKFCQQCGKKLSIGTRLFTTRTFCSNECEATSKALQAELAAELSKVEKEILTSKDVTEQQAGLLKKQDKNSLLDLYSKVYDEFVKDKELEEQEIEILRKIQDIANLTNEDVEFDERVRPYVYVDAIRKDGNLPTVHLQIEGSSPVVLKKGEIVHFADKATLKELRSVSLGYQGGSHGVSFRITKGVSYRVGAHRGHVVREDRFVETSRGACIITNQRLFLHPFPRYKPLSIPLNKILSYQCFNNGLELYKDGREKGYFLSLKSSSVELMGLCLGHLLGQNNSTEND